MVIRLSFKRDLKRERIGFQFDVAYVMSRLIQLFPSIEFEDEYFLKQFKIFDMVTKKSKNRGSIFRMTFRDARERGPICGLVIKFENGKQMKGVLSRYSLSFNFGKGDIPNEEKKKAVDLIKNFETSVNFHGLR